MKKQILLVVIVLLTLGSVSFAQGRKSKGSLTNTLAAREKKLWEAWKNKQAGPFQAALSPDTILVGGSGTQGKAAAIKEITSDTCDVQSYELSEFTVTMFDKNTALLTYKATQSGTCGGTPLPATAMASSLWIKRGGKWWAAFHQETPGM